MVVHLNGEAPSDPALSAAHNHPVVLFDGVCNFCNGSIRFIINRDPRNIFRFAPLQSELGKALLQKHGLPTEELFGLVLVDGEKCWTKSSAALRIAQRMRFPWPICSVMLILPAFFRDFCYDIIARNRYRWFGKNDQCAVPTPELRQRFLA